MGRPSLWTAFLLPALLLAPAAYSLTIHPSCQGICGGVDIPYPFGIGNGTGTDCFRPGFEITCAMGTTPVLAGTSPAVRVLSLSVMPRAEARVTLPVAYQCYDKNGSATSDYNYGTVNLNPAGVYRISNTYNEVVVLGCNTFGYTNSGPAGRSKYMFYTGCACYCNDSKSARDRECAGIGCCHVDIPPGLTDNWMTFGGSWSHADMEFSPCNYAFMVEKGAYTFQAGDLSMQMTQASMPLRLDWAIRDTNGSSMSPSCAQAVNKPGYTCKSNNSECVDSTNGPGYFCNCTKGYEGNPYVNSGCTNINECERSREEYPCNGVCHDTEGSYDCRCPFGYESNGDPKEKPCNPKFSLAAKIALGTTLVTSLVIVALLSVAITFQKRQIFRRNGGNMLKNVDTGLTFFTEKEVKKMTLNYEISIGKGSFGEVYKGKLEDQTTVAVKKSSTEVDKSKVAKFVKEVEIQARMIHKNVLRLKGCCLEVKFPVLVYEFAAKGSLQGIIHGGKIGQERLPLEVRLDIAIGSAEGLAYMHMHTTSKVRHGDVKPDNILLDAQSVPKLADFGLSKVLAQDKERVEYVEGSKGYIDPEYLEEGNLTLANDVYSFGVVLLELITRKQIEPVEGKECKLVTNFRRAYEQENNSPRCKMFDEDIASEENIPVLEEIGKLAIECLAAEEDRPDMIEVARRLGMLKKVRKHGKTNRQSDHHPEETAADQETGQAPLLASDSQRSVP
ncbi:Wall-associated receptor kinase 2 [Dichanthelium oligosanthes]|uniref:Wall-associated receptor kinase 2 n=1 Tax=Dichanthelium oligosanthes TaxID=888268 RepID=A0A1E5UJN4_9POAL|nr:Wall-associated receptor kinase 2 [Dichanthelium oligosanthes]